MDFRLQKSDHPELIHSRKLPLEKIFAIFYNFLKQRDGLQWHLALVRYKSLNSLKTEVFCSMIAHISHMNRVRNMGYQPKKDFGQLYNRHRKKTAHQSRPKKGRKKIMSKCLIISRRLKARLMLSVFVLMILLSIVLDNLPGETTPFSIRTAWAEEENPDEWNDPEDPDDWEGWGDPNFFDQEDIPFHLVNVQGKAPGIEQNSEWKLELKEEWEDRGLPNRVMSVAMNLYCFDMDWKDNWSHVWKTEVQGLPEALPCAGPMIAGRYKLTAVVHYDDTWKEVSAGFTIEGEGYERITGILSQAAKDNKTDDEWQTAFNLYNWLLNRLVYDDTLSYYSSDAILRGTGVCDSYARLYCLLCRAAGLNAYVIYGDTWQGYHAWDAVQINGE